MERRGYAPARRPSVRWRTELFQRLSKLKIAAVVASFQKSAKALFMPFDESLPFGETKMSLGTILLIILILMLIGVFPSWPHSRGWGYGPSSGLGLVLVILVVLLLLGRI